MGILRYKLNFNDEFKVKIVIENDTTIADITIPLREWNSQVQSFYNQLKEAGIIINND